MYKEKFIAAIHAKTKIRLRFHSKEDGTILTRLCAPMDYSPFRSAKNPEDRYHLWDYESDTKNHNLSLLPDRIQSMDFLTESFEPSGFITWQPNWHVQRNWGEFS